jgi:hypothetical protein
MAAHLETARREQLRSRADYLKACEAGVEGWERDGALLGLSDWFSEEFLIEQEKRNGTA